MDIGVEETAYPTGADHEISRRLEEQALDPEIDAGKDDEENGANDCRDAEQP